MRCEAVRRTGRYVGLTVATGLSAAVGAQTVQTGMIVSTGVSAESNPYSSAQSSGASIAATAALQPQAVFRTETSTLSLSGLASFRQFIRRYGLEDNYSGNANLTTRVSDRMSLHASGAVSYTDGGFGNFGRPGLLASSATGSVFDQPTAGTVPVDVSVTDGTLPGQLPLLTDVTLIGLRTRTTSYQAGAGFASQMGGHSSVSGDLGLSALRLRSAGFRAYDSANGEMRYSHELNEMTSIGVIGTVNLTNYRATRTGDTLTESALLSFDRRFGSGWALSLGAGASFSDIKQLPGQPNAHLTALSVRGRFCKRGEYSQLCAGVDRSPQPAASGSVRISNSAVVDYSRRLDDRQSVSLSGSYSRTEAGRGSVLALPAASFASASARYDNQITQRATFFISGNVAKVYGAGSSRRPNIGASAGLQFRFGGLR